MLMKEVAVLSNPQASIDTDYLFDQSLTLKGTLEHP